MQQICAFSGVAKGAIAIALECGFNSHSRFGQNFDGSLASCRKPIVPSEKIHFLTAQISDGK
ncbi:MAG: hypothetical protein F6J95_024895 [Leptolyngbya sp. SIO1E4]|nr:hypothetical protein [Leptolyngbya sp. SIO1E4]